MAFEKVASLSEINPTKYVSVNGKDLALFKAEGKVYCIDNACTHAMGPLSEGTVEGTKVTCPWHSAQFDITTGKVLSSPAREDVTSYKVKVEGEAVAQ